MACVHGCGFRWHDIVSTGCCACARDPHVLRCSEHRREQWLAYIRERAEAILQEMKVLGQVLLPGARVSVLRCVIN